MKDDKLWYPLDNAGKLYSSIISSRATTLFRVSVTLTSPIDSKLLQTALEATLERFPFYKVQLKQGFFWYYFEGTNQIPKVEEEIFYPCMSLSIKRRGTFPFRVLYFNKRIAVELSHSITDGTGALKFLHELLTNYLHLKESVPLNNGPIDQEQLQLETENSFRKYYEKDIPALKSRVGKSYKLPIQLDKRGHYHIVTGIINVDDLKRKAKEYDISITTLVTAIYIESLLKIQEKTARRKQPIVINVPVNMRSFFESETMRNFFVSITPSIDGRLGEYEFEEITEELKIEFNRLLTPKKLKQYIKRSVIGEKSLALRLMPSPVKDILAPSIYSFFGEGQYTSGLSNLGAVQVPSEIEPFIERFECYPPPSIGNKVKAMMISYNQYMYISFGNLSKDRMLEREFFRSIRKLGIDVTIETNDEEN
ncbi:alcohol acetyltransferase [Virgibacillus profundi]|uniref:Alcohol acetyltransferase n=1 Tax=Virgibacillus profundi TaxID=2024555 RepID=A0A2A2IAQ4_9BACI|nr:alcohol acetyltransferase [Virgibacillus profundi]PAV28200.1 alcohol acetyltransferase [Virgibacillus profundi]PXY52505.1 alcohol acetyltransferase [Virgibacillus profundi]